MAKKSFLNQLDELASAPPAKVSRASKKPRARGLRKVSAWQGYAVYADYDANAPDTKDLILVATEELAKQACEKLNENPRGVLAYVEGYEWCKCFRYHEALSTRKSDFATTLEAALSEADLENADEDEEDEQDG